MSINNVNNLNKADLVKLAMAKKGGKTAEAQKPAYMTMSGSVFNAPAPNTTSKTSTTTSTKTTTSSNIDKLNDAQKSYEDIDSLKTTKQLRNAISDLENDMQSMNPIEKMRARIKLNKLNEKKSEVAEQEFQDSMNNLKSIGSGQGTTKSSASKSTGNSKEVDGRNVSASEGKAMAADAEADAGSVEKQTTQTEANTKEMNKLSKNSVKLNKELNKSEKKFNKQMQKDTKEVQENEKQIQKEIKAIEEKSMQVTDMQRELESLQSSGGDAKRMQELAQQIGTTADSMVESRANIQKLQTATSKKIATMNRVTMSQSKYYLKLEKGIEDNQKTSDKVLKVAEKIDDISQTVSQVGSITKKVGKGMIITGQAMSCNPFTAAAGAALISAGGFTEKAGTVVELVGNYGSAAANVTKAACHAANGNFAAALQCAGSAIQSGAAAAKGTKELDKSFKAVDEQVKSAQDQLAAGTAAKQAAAELEKNGELGGMTKKQAAAGMKEELLGQMQNGQVDGKELLNQVKNKNTVGQAIDTANGTFGNVQNTFNQAKEAGLNNLAQSGKKITEKSTKKAINNSFNSSLSEQRSKRLAAATGSMTNPIKGKTSSFENATKVGKGLSTLGAQIGQKQGTQQAGRKQGSYTIPNYTINYEMLERTNKLLRRRA